MVQIRSQINLVVQIHHHHQDQLIVEAVIYLLQLAVVYLNVKYSIIQDKQLVHVKDISKQSH